MVTSSAVVGSSAISSAGLQASAIAIITRWRMPPENQPIDHFAALRTLGQPREYGEMLQQVQRADLWIHAKILRQVAQPAAHGVLVAQHVDRRFAGDAERGRTTVGLLQGGQCAHQRGLARAVRAEQAEHAAREVQADVVECVHAVGVRLGQRTDLQHATYTFPWAMSARYPRIRVRAHPPLVKGGESGCRA
ncbi:hypothetical protein G6F32_014965 [Rhizopus arrhizus]|nr:hypothetical protein G6F32_014965 [Rhizopus arrhizus]